MVRDRRLSGRLTSWVRRIALLAAAAFVYVHLRREIGDLQALLAMAGSPLALLDGAWRRGPGARRSRRRAPGERPAHDRTPVVWLWPMAPREDTERSSRDDG
jgi:hypothetical protein